MDRSRGSPGSPIRFGVFEFDDRTLELRRSGSRVKLEGQPLQVLLLLLKRPGELVTRDELQRALWNQDTFVSFEQGINNCIRRLREVLGDSAHSPHFIETLPRRGYRFIYPLRDSSPPPASAEQRHTPLLAIVALGIVVVLGALAATVPLTSPRAAHKDWPRSIAVLPFENLTGNPGEQYLVDGIHDELLAALAQLQELKVPGRNAVMRFKNETGNVEKIARDIGVDAVLQGSVQHHGSHYVISAQLMDEHARHLWARVFNIDEQHLSVMSTQIVFALARDINLELSPEEESRLRLTKGVDHDAFKLFFRANYYRAKRTRQNLQTAIDLYRQALDVEPTFAPAWNGIGLSYEALGRAMALPPSEAYPKAEAAIEKALVLDPSFADAHKSLATLKMSYDHDWDGAEREAAIAKSLDPQWPGDSLTLVLRGKFDDGIAVARKAAEKNPLDPQLSYLLGLAYYHAGRYDDAIAQLNRTLELDRRNAFTYRVLGWNYVKKGMCREAIQACEQAHALEEAQAGSPPSRLEIRCGWVYASCGRRNDALRGLQEYQRSGQTQWINPGNGAFIYDALGDRDRAAEQMWKAYEAGVPITEYYVCRMCSDALRAHPHYQELRRRIGPPESLASEKASNAVIAR